MESTAKDCNATQHPFRVVSLGDGNHLRPSLSFFKSAVRAGVRMELYVFDPTFDFDEVRKLSALQFVDSVENASSTYSYNGVILCIAKGTVKDYVHSDEKVNMFCILEAAQFMDSENLEARGTWAENAMSECSIALISAAEQVDSQHYVISAFSLAKAAGVGEIWPGSARALARAPQVGQCVGKLLEDVGFTIADATLFRCEESLGTSDLLERGTKWLHSAQQRLLNKSDRVRRELEPFGEMRIKYAVRLWKGIKNQLSTGFMPHLRRNSSEEVVNTIVEVTREENDGDQDLERQLDKRLVAQCVKDLEEVLLSVR